MKKVLVTGANGHLGYNLVKKLVEKGYEVRAGVRNPKNADKTKHLRKLGVEIVAADLQDPNTLKNALLNVDGLFQVAAIYKLVMKNPQKNMITPNVEGTKNILRIALDAGVKKVVYTSSVAAIGIGETAELLTESNWNNTSKNAYMVSKTIY